jgi:hypothetical protein
MAFIPYYAKDTEGLRTPIPMEYTPDNCAVFSLYNMEGGQQDLMVDQWWQMIVTSVTEEHAENHDLHNTLAHTVVSYALGPQPVAVSITGYLLSGYTDDMVGSFFEKYLADFRANRLTKTDRLLQFNYRDTSFTLYIETIGVNQGAGQDDYTEVCIEGYACHYRTNYGIRFIEGPMLELPTSDSALHTKFASIVTN